MASYGTVMIAHNAPQSEQTADLRSVHTSNLPELFDQLGMSLIWSDVIERVALALEEQ
jgi:hypothetical protein